MRDTPQTGFDATDDNGHIGIGFTRALAVDNHRAVGPFRRFGIGCVGVIAAQAAIGRVTVDHRIHVAGGNAEKQFGPAQRAEGIHRMPVRLGNDANTETLRLQQPADDCHAETGVINVSIAGDEDNVAFVPTKLVHLGARHRQERGRAETRRPVLAMAKKVFRAGSDGLHGAHYKSRRPLPRQFLP